MTAVVTVKRALKRGSTPKRPLIVELSRRSVAIRKATSKTMKPLTLESGRSLKASTITANVGRNQRYSSASLKTFYLMRVKARKVRSKGGDNSF